MNCNRSPVVAVGCGCKKKPNFTFISLNAGIVKEYIYTYSLTSDWISNGEMCEFTIRTEPWVHAYTKREFTLIRSLNSGLFDTWIHAYSMREFTLIRCVNSRLEEAWINTCTKCEVMSEDSEDLAFLNHVISRDQNISCNHSPLPQPGCD